jgi:hypothetical protein
MREGGAKCQQPLLSTQKLFVLRELTEITHFYTEKDVRTMNVVHFIRLYEQKFTMFNGHLSKSLLLIDRQRMHLFSILCTWLASLRYRNSKPTLCTQTNVVNNTISVSGDTAAPVFFVWGGGRGPHEDHKHMSWPLVISKLQHFTSTVSKQGVAS